MGLRDYQTKVRFAIDRCFEENQDVTINFSDINDYLLAGGYKVNKTTVYRYLDKLIKEGKIKKYLHEGGKQATYVLVVSEHCMNNHLHMKCVRCNRIIHLDCDFNREIIEYLNRKYDFEVDCSQTIIYGMCNDCKGRD